MKKIVFVLVVVTLSAAAVESPVKTFNEFGYGTVSGRIQSLSMYRDFEGVGNGFNSTLGVLLEYTSPEFGGFDFGLGYNYAGELYDHNKSSMLLNEEIHVLNEAWLRYGIFENTKIKVGRMINNGEVFRKDDYRQKARSIEAVQLEIKEIEGLALTLGHAIRMSNWIQDGDRNDFNDFGDVFGAQDDTDGITWGEAVFTRVDNLEIAIFNAYAYDVANLIGTRVKLDVTETTSLLGYYRHESDVGGLSVEQKVGPVTLSPGYFGVRGDNLRFQEATTGINHPLGVSMMLYSGQFAADSDTLFLKAVTKVKATTLYALYNYTWHSDLPYDGQELNLVVKQPIGDQVTIAVKSGLGYRDGPDNTFASDTRLFATYNF
jgi:hypothetical protein